MQEQREVTIDQIFGTKIAQIENYETKSPIYQRGDSASRLLFVQSGIVLIRNEDSEDPNIIDIAKKGDIFGTDVLLGSQRIHSAEAHVDVQVASINMKKLQILLEKFPGAAMPLLISLGKAHRRAEEYADLMKRGKAPSKIAAAILEFKEGNKACVNHKTIGNRAGVNRVHTTRVIGDLHNNGLISNVLRGNISIIDTDSLEKVATS